MKTVTSVSGGKTSAMMALEYPTDYYIFAVVLTDQVEAAPQDPGLRRECQSRLPGFVASRELDLTLLNVLRLEQDIGQEIKWVASEYTFDSLIAKRGYLPNTQTRFCTEELKLSPIFWHCYLNWMEGEGEPLIMNIGFRSDESERVERMGNCRFHKQKYPKSCDLDGRFKRKQRHAVIEWRWLDFPLHQAGIDTLDVAKYWHTKGWRWPEVSNCDGCFFHRPFQNYMQYQSYPARMQWWADKEKERGSSFRKDRTYSQIYQQLPLFDTGSDHPCNCTD